MAVLSPLTWRGIQPADAGAPDGRWGHSITCVADKYVIVIGGLQAGRTLNDAWVYHLETSKWARWWVEGWTDSSKGGKRGNAETRQATGAFPAQYLRPAC